MKPRLLLLAALALVLLLGAAGVAYWEGFFAPQAARLLPDTEGTIYIDLRHIRLASDFSPPPASHEPEYADFLQQTGFQFERDLDEVAVAMHAPEPTLTPSTLEFQRRFTEVFVGRFDRERLRRYLRSLATEVERYRDSEIFVIPFEGRTVRAVLLSGTMVAASNTSDPAVIRQLIDRQQRSVLSLRIPWMLRTHYRHVPWGSTAWAILELKGPWGTERELPLPGGLGFAMPANSVTVASLRYTGSLGLRVEGFTRNEKDAERLYASVANFLQLFRALEGVTGVKGPDADVKALFASLRVEREDRRVILTADLPSGFLKKLLTEPPASAPPPPGGAKQRK
jgi:hypothetical protein